MHKAGRQFQAVRGMNDVVPLETPLWQWFEKQFSDCLSQYGYQEIRFPFVENTHLFRRTIGDVTDIVEKEMYTFSDLNGDSLSLRPEGTAGCIRACLEHGLIQRQSQKVWYMGPMFRHERPQKGRYRQFTQCGVEAIGIPGVGIELELLAMAYRFWQKLGIHDVLTLQVNTLGEPSERKAYEDALTAYFLSDETALPEDVRHRLQKNPLRVLDSKDPIIQEKLTRAPLLLDFLGAESRQRFDGLCTGLSELNIPFTIVPTLVRGLDYYAHTVFEWTTDKLGSQATVCAGGRYDGLVEQLGGVPTPAVGWALGVERLLLLMEAVDVSAREVPAPFLFLMAADEVTLLKMFLLCESLRQRYPSCVILLNTVPGSFKNQFKKADKSGAHFALIMGESEFNANTITVKPLRTDRPQTTVFADALITYLDDYLKENPCQFT